MGSGRGRKAGGHRVYNEMEERSVAQTRHLRAVGSILAQRGGRAHPPSYRRCGFVLHLSVVSHCAHSRFWDWAIYWAAIYYACGLGQAGTRVGRRGGELPCLRRAASATHTRHSTAWLQGWTPHGSRQYQYVLRTDDCDV